MLPSAISQKLRSTRLAQMRQSRREPVIIPREKSPEEIEAAKDALTERVKPRWLRVMDRLSIVTWAVEYEQLLYEMMDSIDTRNMLLGPVPTTSHGREPSGPKCLMTLSRGEERARAKAHHGVGPTACRHLRTDLKPLGANQTFWVNSVSGVENSGTGSQGWPNRI